MGRFRPAPEGPTYATWAVAEPALSQRRPSTKPREPRATFSFLLSSLVKIPKRAMSLLFRAEIFLEQLRIRRRLVLLDRHQITFGIRHVGPPADHDPAIVFGAIVFLRPAVV